jgi:hypothetical protein
MAENITVFPAPVGATANVLRCFKRAETAFSTHIF